MFKKISLWAIILFVAACESDVRNPDPPPSASNGSGGVSPQSSPSPSINPQRTPRPIATPSFLPVLPSPSPGDLPVNTPVIPIPQPNPTQRPSPATPSPSVTYAINAGGGVFISEDGTLFRADSYGTGGKTARSKKSIMSTNDDVLFQSERFGSFSYELPVSDGMYSIYVFFSENYFGEKGKRLFDISVEEKPIASGVDVFALSGGKHTAYSLLINNVIVRDSALSLAFLPTTSNAMIAGIKVIPAMTSGRLDTDNDGVDDNRDRCPFTYGFGSIDGCVRPVSTQTALPIPTSQPTISPPAIPSPPPLPLPTMPLPTMPPPTMPPPTMPPPIPQPTMRPTAIPIATPTPTFDLAMGKQLYESAALACAACHGKNGEGTSFPGVTGAKFLQNYDFNSVMLKTKIMSEKNSKYVCEGKSPQACSYEVSAYIWVALNGQTLPTGKPSGGPNTGIACDIKRRSGIRRLTKTEMKFAIEDVFGVQVPVYDTLPKERNLGGFESIGSIQNSNSSFVLPLLDAAMSAAATILDGGAFNHSCTLNTIRNCVKSTLRPYAEKLSASKDVDSLLDQLGDMAAESNATTPDERIRDALSSMLMSSSFLFAGIEVEADERALTSIDIAKALARTLWLSVPDDELREAAVNNQLATPQAISAQIDRMMADRRFDRFKSQFFNQWLGFDNVERYDVDAKALGIADWAAIANDMSKESTLFMQELLDNNRSIKEILNANYSFLNGRLAKHYGIGGVNGTNWQRVNFPASANRRGLLTQGAILTRAASGEHASVVIRGETILSGLSCDPPASPDASIQDEVDQLANANLSEAQKMAARAGKPACDACHGNMDAIGWAFTGFDAAGRTLSDDATGHINDGNIDPSGSYKGALYNGPLDMITLLNEQDRLEMCLSEKFMMYTLGRPMSYNANAEDNCVIDDVLSKLRKALPVAERDIKIKDLIKAVLVHDVSRFQGTQP